MLVRVKLVGKGTNDDPHRANLPTYQELLTIVDDGHVYALIPDSDHPELDKHPSAKTIMTGHGAALIGLDESGHGEWHSHLDSRYKEHKGEFRPEIV